MPSMTPARTREELDAYIRRCCTTPKCRIKHKMIFMCERHLEAPVNVYYKMGSGLLDIRCAICNGQIAELELASSERVLHA